MPANEDEKKPATGGLSLATSSFKMSVGLAGAAEFIPKGMVVKTTDQFPDLDDLDDKP